KSFKAIFSLPLFWKKIRGKLSISTRQKLNAKSMGGQEPRLFVSILTWSIRRVLKRLLKHIRGWDLVKMTIFKHGVMNVERSGSEITVGTNTLNSLQGSNWSVNIVTLN